MQKDNRKDYKMTQRSNQAFLLPIPLETFRDFFCLDKIATVDRTSESFGEISPFELGANICDYFDIQAFGQHILAAAQAEGSTSTMITDLTSGIFLSLRFKKDATTYHMLTVTNLVQMPAGENGKPYYTPKPVFILAGVESNDATDPQFIPALAQVYIEGEDENGYEQPITGPEFFAVLNYMRFAMLSCVRGDTPSPQINQLLLSEGRVETAINMFTESLAKPDLRTALSDYYILRRSIETAFEVACLEQGIAAPQPQFMN